MDNETIFTFYVNGVGNVQIKAHNQYEAIQKLKNKEYYYVSNN